MSTCLTNTDNETIQIISKIALEKADANVILANDGAEALALLAEIEHVDYILTDIFMPNMNGYELCQTLRRQDIQTPIIVITASVLGEEVEKAMSSGADAVIEKPMSAESVQHALNQITR